MRIQIVTPGRSQSRSGNGATARRWARLLRELGHTVRIQTQWQPAKCDLLVALHARKSELSVRRYREQHPNGKLIVVLTGTDLYQDLPRGSRKARQSIALADHLIVLQPLALRALTASARNKATVMFQSATTQARRPLKRVFEVAVVGHLRSVKDPFRAAIAARRLPRASRIQIVQLGNALEPQYRARAQQEMERNPRYLWLNGRSRAEALRRIERARVMVLASRSEGGANVVSEAVSAGVPVLASRIPGNVGLLGEKYPGYFPVGDTRALTALLRRVEETPSFHEDLARAIQRLARLFTPARERAAWKKLLSRWVPQGHREHVHL